MISAFFWRVSSRRCDFPEPVGPVKTSCLVLELIINFMVQNVIQGRAYYLVTMDQKVLVANLGNLSRALNHSVRHLVFISVEINDLI